ncbi:LPS export ABC transporter permease LptF [Reinekea sp.]|uniref:LPS export ABC transporter permease LptF n=1 Tax=Reinekea sp. TaxID=1970455 RepID=UPI003988CCBA
MIFRYIFTETLKPFIFITVVLIALLTTAELSDTVQQVIAGLFEQQAIYKIIGFTIPVILPELLPPAYLLAILISQNRLSQDSERTIFNAAGLSDQKLTSNLLITTALPLTFVMWLFTLFITPSFALMFEQYSVDQNNRPITDLVDPGEFFNLPNNMGTLYAADSSPITGKLLDVYVIQHQEKGTTVISANSLKIDRENQSSTQYLMFENGRLITQNLNSGSDQSFTSYSVALPIDSYTYTNNKLNTMSTKTLTMNANQWQQSEFLWRILYPLIIPVLCIWGVGLTKVKPRQARVGAIAIGIALYVVYSYIFKTLNASIAYSKLPLWAHGWWLHSLAVFLGWWLFMRQKHK